MKLKHGCALCRWRCAGKLATGFFLLEGNLGGDVQKLKGSKNEYRLRIGNYRALFELEGRVATVYAVGDRKEIYR